MRRLPKQDNMIAVMYAQNLHPGTFVTPKHGCLKPQSPEVLLHQNGVRPAQGGNQRRVHSSPKVQKKVSFHVVDIRHYDREPGDNPSVSRGVALSLGWELIQVKTFPIDEYEQQLVAGKRRVKKDFLLTEHERERLLHDEWGYSLKAIDEASKISLDVKKKRIQSLILKSNPRLEKLDEVMQYSRKKFESWLSPKGKEYKQILMEKEARDILLDRKLSRITSEPNLGSLVQQRKFQSMESSKSLLKGTISESLLVMSSDKICESTTSEGAKTKLGLMPQALSKPICRSISVPIFCRFFVVDDISKGGDGASGAPSVLKQKQLSDKGSFSASTLNNESHEKMTKTKQALMHKAESERTANLKAGSTPSFLGFSKLNNKQSEDKDDGWDQKEAKAEPISKPKLMTKPLRRINSLPSFNPFSEKKQKKDVLSVSLGPNFPELFIIDEEDGMFF